MPSAKMEADWAGHRPWVWGLVFGAGMGFIAWLEHQRLIVQPWNFALVALFSLSLWPLARSAANAAARLGARTAAVMRYNRRLMGASFGYVLGLGIGITVHNGLHPHGMVQWLLAALPSLPILYGIRAMALYLKEEEDEYLRLRAASAALYGLALIMIVGTCWGFLELFGAVPHIWAWWVVPVWAVGLGLGHTKQTRSDCGQQEQ